MNPSLVDVAFPWIAYYIRNLCVGFFFSSQFTHPFFALILLRFSHICRTWSVFWNFISAPHSNTKAPIHSQFLLFLCMCWHVCVFFSLVLLLLGAICLHIFISLNWEIQTEITIAKCFVCVARRTFWHTPIANCKWTFAMKMDSNNMLRAKNDTANIKSWTETVSSAGKPELQMNRIKKWHFFLLCCIVFFFFILWMCGRL